MFSLIEAYMVVVRRHRGVRDAAQLDVVIYGRKAGTVRCCYIVSIGILRSCLNCCWCLGLGWLNFQFACSLFHCTQSTYLTPFPPKQSRALPMVRSTLPALSSLTSSRSSRLRPPPA